VVFGARPLEREPGGDAREVRGEIRGGPQQERETLIREEQPEDPDPDRESRAANRT
jgi:hypothetical protein